MATLVKRLLIQIYAISLFTFACGLVLPELRCRHAECGNAVTVGEILSFRVTTQYTHDNGFIYIWHSLILFYIYFPMNLCDSAISPCSPYVARLSISQACSLRFCDLRFLVSIAKESQPIAVLSQSICDS